MLVALKFQKDLEAEEHGAIAPDEDATTEAFRRWRMSWIVPGFVVRDRRTVTISDLFLPPGAIASVEVRTLDGTAYPARLRGFLRRAEGLIVATETDLPVEPVPFVDEPTATVGSATAGRIHAERQSVVLPGAVTVARTLICLPRSATVGV